MLICVGVVETGPNACLDNQDNGGCHSARTCTKTDTGRTCEDCATGWTNDGETGCTGLCEGAVRVGSIGVDPQV